MLYDSFPFERDGFNSSYTLLISSMLESDLTHHLSGNLYISRYDYS